MLEHVGHQGRQRLGPGHVGVHAVGQIPLRMAGKPRAQIDQIRSGLQRHFANQGVDFPGDIGVVDGPFGVVRLWLEGQPDLRLGRQVAK